MTDCGPGHTGPRFERTREISRASQKPETRTSGTRGRMEERFLTPASWVQKPEVCVVTRGIEARGARQGGSSVSTWRAAARGIERSRACVWVEDQSERERGVWRLGRCERSARVDRGERSGEVRRSERPIEVVFGGPAGEL
jgi:hypothetical protein